MADIAMLTDKDGNQKLPPTVAKAVYNGNERLDNRLSETPRYKDPLGTSPSIPRDADTLAGKSPSYYENTIKLQDTLDTAPDVPRDADTLDGHSYEEINNKLTGFLGTTTLLARWTSIGEQVLSDSINNYKLLAYVSINAQNANMETTVLTPELARYFASVNISIVVNNVVYTSVVAYVDDTTANLTRITRSGDGVLLYGIK